MNKRTASHYGAEGRLGASPQEILVRTAYQHDCNAAGTLLPGLHKADLAYAIMLREQGIVPAEEGQQLIRGLFELSQGEPPVIDPALGDVYNSKDQALVALIGHTAGWLHIGRARREAVNIAYLLDLRERLLDYVLSLTEMASVLVDVAEREKASMMLDYTYLHHAQPTTFGHYIMTFLFPLLRDLDRVVASYGRINRSPAGSGSVNGGNLPIDRELLRELLCFEALSVHTRDAMWQVDTPLECIGDVISVMVNLNRMSDELQLWSTAEFNAIELPGSLCRASVIMPQKKNPYPLAYFRGVTNSLLGRHASFASYGKIMSGNPDSRVFVYEELPSALAQSAGALQLLAAVLESMKVNREVLRARLDSSFAYASDLAELICSVCHLNYRTAHAIVGASIRQLNDSGSGEHRVTTTLLDASAEQLTGKPLGLADDVLKAALNPEHILSGRQTAGGAGQQEIEEMIRGARGSIAGYVQWAATQRQKLGYTLLEQKINEHLKH